MRIGMIGIYAIMHAPTGRCYVGSSKSLERRIQTHLSRLRSGQHNNLNLASVWDSSTENEWTIFVLERCKENNRFDREQYWINSIDCSFNRTKIVDIYRCDGEFWKGRKHSHESILKMSRTTTGMKTGPCSEERKKKVAKALCGKPLSEERKKNISLARKGKPLTEKQKLHLKKLHSSMKGRVWTEKEKMALRGIRKSAETKERMRLAWIKRRQLSTA
jgi:group I intron endonuclease